MMMIDYRYQIIKPLGRGGMGSVYLAEDHLLHRRVALKMLHSKYLRTNEVDQFRSEFQVMTRLKHPNLARVYDFGYDEVGHEYFLTMEYCPGQTLKNHFTAPGTITSQTILDIFVPLLRAIEFIHSRNILHRDLKPSNIMIHQGHIKVMDFGLSELRSAEKHTSRGTLMYLAPEIVHSKPADASADIFALGLTLFELLTGETFYHRYAIHDRDTGLPMPMWMALPLLADAEKFTAYQNQTLQLVESQIWRDILRRMTAYHPTDRYSQCTDILMDLNQTLQLNIELETKTTREAYVLGAEFIGREREFQQVVGWLDHPDSGKKALLVHGDAGIGKSRLFEEFRYHCQLQNLIFMQSDSVEQGQHNFGAFLPLISEVLLQATPSQIEKYGADLKKILPLHRQLKHIRVSPSSDPQTERQILIYVIVDVLLDYARHQNRRIILYLNDGQWFDETSLQTLQELLCQLESVEEDLPLRVYVSSRESGMALFTPLIKKGQMQDLALSSFTPEHVQRYLAAIFGKGNIAKHLKDAIPDIQNRVGGNPFFLQELIKSLVEREFICRTTRQWELVQPIDQVEVPAKLTDLLASRLHHLNLPPHQNDALHILSVLHHAPDLMEFQTLVAVSPADLFQLERLELVRLEKTEDSIRYHLAHDLIRETITAQIEDVTALHLHVATCLETFHHDNLAPFYAELAHHYVQAEAREKAIEYLEKAGDQAKANYQNKEALQFYDQLLQFYKSAPNDENHAIEVMLRKGNILNLIGEWDTAEAIYREGITRSGRIGAERLKSNFLGALGALLKNRSQFEEALECHRQALTIREQLHDTPAMARSMLEIITIYQAQANYEEALRLAEKQQRLSQEANDRIACFKVLKVLGIIHYSIGNYSQALDFFQQQLAMMQQYESMLATPNHYANVYGHLGACYVELDQLEEALKYVTLELRYFEKMNDRLGISYALETLAMIHHRQGHLAEALRIYRDQRQVSIELGDVEGNLIAELNIGSLLYEQGAYEASLTHSFKALELAEQIHHRRVLPTINGNIGEIYRLMGKIDSAKHYIERQIQWERELGQKTGLSIGLDNRAKIYYQDGQYERALDDFTKAIDLGRETQIPYYLCSYLIHKATVLYHLKNYPQATVLNQEGLQLAERVKRTEYSFKGKRLQLKIDYACQKLTKEDVITYYQLMRKEYPQPQEQADIYYELYCLTQEPTYAITALNLYQDLYQQTPKIAYQQRAENLRTALAAPSENIIDNPLEFY
ncbi:MAG: hypothetical protein D6675_12000 [Gemmatimonadetes bacterium]|nr:MAG: hypothetical protein D6675_12000 [Gemmatimonadota bacterium]